MSTDPWWTIDTGINRIGVQAPNVEAAFDRFIEAMHPSYSVAKYGRMKPPKRDDCTVRRATQAEVVDFTTKGKRRPAPTQDEALFDGSTFDKRAKVQ